MPTLSSKLVYPFLWFLAAILLAVAWFTAPGNPALHAQFRPELAGPAVDGNPVVYREGVIAAYDDGVAHSPTIAAYEDGSLQAIWFHGQTEAGTDIRLDESRFEKGAWSPVSTLLSGESETAERGFHVKTIGNPVLTQDGDGATLLFYVTPSIGGWSASRISVRRSTDQGRNWGKPVLLRTSPVLNLSTLARFGAVAMGDGLIGLPAYHQLAKGYGLLVVIDGDLRVRDQRRLSRTTPMGIQPLVIPGAGGHADAYLRPMPDMARRAYRTSTDDGGLTWTDPVPTVLRNPGAPVCGVSLAGGAAVLGYNDDEKHRSNISFAYRESPEAKWRRLTHVIARDDDGDQISYCTMTADSDGLIHTVFSKSADRSIREVVFSRAWIRANLDAEDAGVDTL